MIKLKRGQEMKRVLLTLSILFVFVVGLSCASAATVDLDYYKEASDDIRLCECWEHPFKDPDFIKKLIEEHGGPVGKGPSTEPKA